MLTVIEAINNMHNTFNPEAIANLEKTIQWNITGAQAGQWTFKIHHQTCEILSGDTEKPDLSFSMRDTDYISLAQGELDAKKAFLSGKIKIKGNFALAMRIPQLFPAAGINNHNNS